MDVAISSDGAKSFVLQVEESGGDLMCVYNDASAEPTTTKDIDAAGVYQSGGNYGACLMSADGETIKVLASTTDQNLHLWTTTDGADGTWSETANVNPTLTGLKTFAGFARGTASLADMVFPTNSGLWITDDSGATWTEDVTLPYGGIIYSVAISADGNTIYACDSGLMNKVWKTTDKGTTWTTLVTVSDLAIDFGTTGMEAPNLTHIAIDSSDNLYAILVGLPQDTDYGGMAMAIGYSDDAGASWTTSYYMYPSTWDGSATFSVPYQNVDCQVNPAGTELTFGQWDTTDLVALSEVPLTSGKFPPYILEPDWKMVAD
jgi:hypothetical protein